MLNLPLLIGTLGAVVALGPAGYCWHAYQTTRTAEAFLEEAGRLEAHGEFAKAAGYLHQYLRVDPDDADVRIRLAETFDKSARDLQTKWRAKDLYYEALRAAPSDRQPRLRRRLAELLLELGSTAQALSPRADLGLLHGLFASAEAEVQKLLAAVPQDPHGLRLLGLARYGQLESGALAGKRQTAADVVKALEDALLADVNRGDIELSVALAELYRDEKQFPDHELSLILAGSHEFPGVRARIARVEKTPLAAEPSKILSAVHPQGAEGGRPTLSRLLKAAYGATQGKGKSLSRDQERSVLQAVRKAFADDVVGEMVAANPKSSEALLARYRHRRKYGLAGAKEDLELALQLAPDATSVLLEAGAYAEVEAARAQQTGGSPDEVRRHLDEARAHYEHAIKVDPFDKRAHLRLGEVYLALNEFDRAIQTWRQALEHIENMQLEVRMSSRLAEVLIDLGRLDEAWIPNPDPNNPDERAKAEKSPLGRLDALRRNLAPRLPASGITNLDGLRRALRGKWLVRNRQYAEAIPLLEAVTTGQQAAPEEVVRVYQARMLLGVAYGGLGRWGPAAGSYEEAASLRPTLPSARLAAAEAWRKARRLDLAVQQYKLALAVADDPEVRFRLAETEFARQVRLSEGERDWNLFNTALEELKKPESRDRLNDPWRVSLLEASYLIAQLKDQSPNSEAVTDRSQAIRRAKELLEQAQQQYSESPQLLGGLVAFYERLGDPAAADRALGQYEKLTNGAAEAWLLRAGLFSGRKQYEEARAALREGMQKLPPETRGRLQAALPEISLAEGDLERARKELLSLHNGDPSNLDFIRRLAGVALQMNRLEDLNHLESKLRAVEGPNGLYWRYYRASRLLEEARQMVAAALAKGDPQALRSANAEAAKQVAQAAALCNELRTARPEWAPAHAVSGRAFELQGRFDQAITAYKNALDLGGPDARVYERLVPLLDRLNRFDEADRYLARLKAQGGSVRNLLQYEISAAERQGGLPQAIEAARRGVESRPRDSMTRIWYGRTLFADGQKDAAEAEFKQAVELAPADARSYLALFNFYARTQQREQAEQTLQALAQKAQLSKVALAYQLAQSYEQLGDLQKAVAHYQEAENLANDSTSKIAIKYRLASLLRRSDLAETEKVLREILASASEADAASQKIVEAARQSLVDLLAQRALASPGAEGENEWQEVQRLLQGSGSAGKVSGANQRLQALLWVRRGGEDDLERARQVFERLVEGAKEDVDVDRDRFFLALVYAAQSALYQQKSKDAKNDAERSEFKEARRQSTMKSREQFIPIVARENPNPLYLESYIDLLVRHAEVLPQQLKDEATGWRRRLETIVTQAEPNVTLASRYFNLLRRHNLQDEADQWLTRLEKLAPENLYVLSLRVVWLHDRGRTAEIEPLVERLASTVLKTLEKDAQQKVQREARICLSIGNIYASVQQDQAAERWYRRLATLVPEGYEPLAMSLARQGRVTEAIRVCLEAAASDRSTRPVKVAASILVGVEPTPEDSELAEPLLSRAIADHPEDVDLLTRVANARIRQKRVDEAIPLYERVLALQPKNALALNNLATLLAEQPARVEKALDFVEQAIEIAGPTPQLLDTKGTALIYSGKAIQAIPVLEKAASGVRTDPRFPFHLAVAYYRAGQTGKAKESFAKALDGDLEKQILTKKDQELLVELQQELRQ
jgi:tetratricopeptide (TPR) repeat protein